MGNQQVFSINQLFRNCISENANLPFVHFNDKTYSYEQCNQLIEETTKEMNISDNQFVGLISSNRLEFVIAYLAILYSGGKVVPINPKLGAEEVKYIVKDANISAIVHYGEIPLDLSYKVLIDNPECQLNITSTADKYNSSPITYPENIDDVAVCIYTSGTTGRPKGALLTHSAVIANAQMCAQNLSCQTKQECFVTVLPLFHSYAASTCLIQSICTGSSMLIIEAFNPVEVLRQMEVYKATALFAVPAMYAVLANLENTPTLPNLRLAISGGAPLPEVVNNAFVNKFNIPIHEGDGPTECGPVTSINPIDGKIKVGTIGTPLIGVEMKVVDETGSEVTNNEVGEIIVKSPSNFIGYLNQPEESAKTIVDDWVFTGDLGIQDDDGYFSIIDRKKDMLIVGGLNVYPREVEEYIYHHEDIAEVAVIGEQHELRGEVPIAFISLKEDKSLTLTDLKAFLKDKIAQYKIPKKVHIVEALPRNATGKILKTVLRENNH